MNILVTGGSGQLGRAIKDVADSITMTNNFICNFMNLQSIIFSSAKIRQKFSIFANCMGYDFNIK